MTELKQFLITRETLEHLPPLHRLAAEAAIADGRWKLVKDDSAPEAVNHG